jgi:hypothetical protein
MSSSVTSVMRKARTSAKSYAAPDWWKPEKTRGGVRGEKHIFYVKIKKMRNGKKR